MEDFLCDRLGHVLGFVLPSFTCAIVWGIFFVQTFRSSIVLPFESFTRIRVRTRWTTVVTRVQSRLDLAFAGVVVAGHDR